MRLPKLALNLPRRRLLLSGLGGLIGLRGTAHALPLKTLVFPRDPGRAP